MGKGFFAVNENNVIKARGINNAFNLPGQNITVIPVGSIELPDEMLFCKYENGQVVVDQAFKTAYLEAQATIQAETEQKKDEIRAKTKGLKVNQIDNQDAIDYVKIMMVEDNRE